MSHRRRRARRATGGTVISPTRRSHGGARRATTGLAVLVCSCLAPVVLAAPTSAGVWSPRAQSDSTTTTAPADENPLLVPGPTGEDEEQPAADSGTADVEVEPGADDAGAQDDPDAGSTNDEAEDTVRTVMLALVAVAVALTALTVYYWWRTRPARRTSARRRDDELEHDEGGPADQLEDDEAAPSVEPTGPVGSPPMPVGGTRAERRARRESGASPATDDDDASTVGTWQTDSTSTR